MQYRYRLRTFFAVFTAIAICLGGNLAVWRLLGLPKGNFDRTWLAAHILQRFPYYLVCVVGGLIIFERRKNCPVPSRLALAAVGLALSWEVLGPLTEMLSFLAVSFQSSRWIGIGRGFIISVVDAACWGLLLTAFALAATKKEML